MTHDHAHEGAMLNFGEAQRSPDFREARTTLIDDIRQLHDGYTHGMNRTFGNFRIGKTPAGAPIVTVREDGRDMGEIEVVFDEVAHKKYELGDGYKSEGQIDVVASYKDTVFNETTRQFERVGWEVLGSGAVERLSCGVDSRGMLVNKANTTNDVLDLHMADDYLQGVIDDAFLPVPNEE